MTIRQEIALLLIWDFLIILTFLYIWFTHRLMVVLQCANNGILYIYIYIITCAVLVDGNGKQTGGCEWEANLT